MEYSREELQELKRMATENLYFFCRAILGFDYMTPEVHGPMCDFLQEYKKRDQLTCARGFLKTTIGSVGRPIWLTLPADGYDSIGTRGQKLAKFPFRGPNFRCAIAMKTIDNAIKTVDQIRSIYDKNELFRLLWPELLPTKDCKWSGTIAVVNRPGYFREGTYQALGIGTTATSLHFDMIIEDDLVAPDKDSLTGLEAMPTREEIEKAIGWHKLARSLLVNLGESVISNIGTRWAKFDLIQHIIDNEPNTPRLEINARDAEGAPTYPSRFTESVLREIEEEQGTYIFSSQYLGKPYDPALMVFLDEWLQHHHDIKEPSKVPPHMRLALIVDPAISQKKDACNTAIGVVGTEGFRLYALDYVARKLKPHETVDIMISMALKWGLSRIYVESIAWQEALIYNFNIACKERGIYLSAEPITPGSNESKDTRIRGLQPIAQRGDLLLAPWMRELKSELRDFPFGKTVDLADMLAYGPKVLDIQYRPTVKVVTPSAEGYTMGDAVEELRSRATRRFGFLIRDRRAC